MDLAQGQVIAVHPGFVVVSVAPGPACPRCAAGKGCGAGLLSSREQREIRVPTVSGLQPGVGEQVELAIPPADLLQGAICAWGVPLAGMVLALAVARLSGAALSDPAAVTVAAAGLAAAWLGSRSWLKRSRCLLRLQPGIIGRHGGAG